MAQRKSLFDSPLNIITGVTDEDYRREEARLAPVLDVLSKISSCGYYIVDYFKKDFLYVSPNIAYWCGIPAGKVKAMGVDEFINHAPKDDLERLIELHNEWFKMLYVNSHVDCLKTSLIFDFRFKIAHKPPRMINHRVTPYALKDGKLWLEMCVVTMSSEISNGCVMMRKDDEDSYLEYSFRRHKWSIKDNTPLTETEFEILLLSARGLTIEAIADEIGLKPDTVRKYRQVILKKLNTTCFASAALHSMNYNLLKIKS